MYYLCSEHKGFLMTLLIFFPYLFIIERLKSFPGIYVSSAIIARNQTTFSL